MEDELQDYCRMMEMDGVLYLDEALLTFIGCWLVSFYSQMLLLFVSTVVKNPSWRAQLVELQGDYGWSRVKLRVGYRHISRYSPALSDLDRQTSLSRASFSFFVASGGSW